MKTNPTYSNFLLEDKSNKLVEYFKKNRVKVKVFFSKVKQEIDESTRMGILIKRKLKGDNLTKEEIAFVKNQLRDLLVSLELTVAYFSMIPFATLISLLFIKIAKKHGHDFTPSSFRK